MSLDTAVFSAEAVAKNTDTMITQSCIPTTRYTPTTPNINN